MLNKFRYCGYRFTICFLVCAAAICAVVSAHAQTEDAAALRARADALINGQNFIEALPLYERLSVLTPTDPVVFRNLGAALIAKGQASSENQDAWRQLRLRARNAFITARNLGDNSTLVEQIIEALASDVDEQDTRKYSENVEANEAMKRGEAFFSSGKMDEAFTAFQEALALDPRCYLAALFSGDAKLQKQQYDEAEKWYQRAIAIDPYVETAYRYSATPFMKQGKYDQARDRYIEAYITSPYERMALNGLTQWGQVTNTPLGHPRIDAPKTTNGPDGKKNTTITVNPVGDDGSIAWIAYYAEREEWEKKKFAETYPNEKTYRHSLAEEADALRSVVSMAKSLKPKKLNDQIAMIEKLDNDGVLEAYILLATPDQGIAQDHRAYLEKNRDKLRLYVTKYVIGAGAK